MQTNTNHFDTLLNIHNCPKATVEKYHQMRSLLETITMELTHKDAISFPDLFSRLYYICSKAELGQAATRRINTFRVRSNRIIHSLYHPTEAEYKQDLRSLCDAIAHFYQTHIPEALSIEINTIPEEEKCPGGKKIRRYDKLRVMVLSWDKTYIYAVDEESEYAEEYIKINHDKTSVENEYFKTSLALVWKYCRMNLLDVTIDRNNVCSPQLIILEPDYLIDISALSECMNDYGRSPLYYLQHRFEPPKNSKHIMLGNAANYFLDEFVNEKPETPQINFSETIKKHFQTAPFEYATCPDIDTVFFAEAKQQFENIRHIVNTLFIQENIDKSEATLEPSFICEQLGIQGRMDFLVPNVSHPVLIELKSGRAPYPERDYTLVGLSHRTQAFLYQIVLQKVLGLDFNKLRTYVLYSKYKETKANLRFIRPYMASIKEILNIRNQIVAIERDIAYDKTGFRSSHYIDLLTPETLVTDRINQNFLYNYIIPQIKEFKTPFDQASPLELSYFHTFHSFIAREHFLAKSGTYENETNRGFSSLWLSTLDNKKEEGEILLDLTIKEIHTDAEHPTATLSLPTVEACQEFVSNFRNGDIILLYERNSDADNVTNKQVFRGAIERLSPEEITIRLRAKQRNISVFPANSKYAIEHDFMESSYNGIYKGLYSFLQANKDRRELLLNQRSPRYDITRTLSSKTYINKEIYNIILKARQADDYFILVGPPGTGKTSCLLKSLVEEFHSEADVNILLLSYTNRAIDEICEALDNIQTHPPYIRLGKELSCKKEYRGKLFDKIVEQCRNRQQVLSKIQEYRIFVSTTTSMLSKTELFKLKHFHVAIIDEASQILEPQIIGILSAKDANGDNAIGKFIMIGDHKQLPAIVLQSPGDSDVTAPELRSIGLTNMRKSLFERLYISCLNSELTTDMLYKQGRMHPEISSFPNQFFYRNKLVPIPLKHQEGPLEFHKYDASKPMEKLVASQRMAFIPAERAWSRSNKNNINEARIVASLALSIYELYIKNSIPLESEKSLGIITPYRSQIAMIKKEIYDLNIPLLNEITIDTVERYQGSQRDIIIYSFSVNVPNQLEFIANTMEEDGTIIDRKLNVVLTRAKKQIFITGNPDILYHNEIFRRLIDFIRSQE
ncbi:MAG: AAA family ATPase [Tannerellaceae bacterium]|jgi:superfamily I DNA and/or RNA helicase|nr:AAA family ATPase [Tannerellaceae bacterium]